MEGVVSHELTHEDEVAQVDSLVELDVEPFLCSGDEEVGVELVTEFLHELETLLQTFLGTTHTNMLPHDVSELLVDRVNRTLTLDIHQTVGLCLNSLLCLCKFGQVGTEAWPYLLVSEVVLDGVRQYEVTVGQALHKSRGTETVSTVVREVTLTDSKQTRDGGLQLVVNPDTTHGVVDSWEDHHRLVVLHAVDLVGEVAGEHVGDLLIHLEEVTITLHDLVDAETVDTL